MEVDGFLGRANSDPMETATMLVDDGDEFFIALKVLFCFYTVKTVFDCPINGDNPADGACCLQTFDRWNARTFRLFTWVAEKEWFRSVGAP